MKISCKVAEDLIPLYVDECCSEDTKQLLEEHLGECEACKQKSVEMKQPMFLPQKPGMNEKTYAKHAKKAFGKLRRRLIAAILVILLVLVPLTWLGVNEYRGEGISYSNLTYVLRGNALLRALKNGNYEKAFSYLELENYYERNKEGIIKDLERGPNYKRVKIGEDSFYVSSEIYSNEYQKFLKDANEANFWRIIYQKNSFMIPVNKADLYFKDYDVEWHDLLKYKVKDNEYYINADSCNYDIDNVKGNTYSIMPEDYYNQVKKQMDEDEKEENKELKEILKNLDELGYDGYEAIYKQQWIDRFKKLKEEGVTIVGYKIIMLVDNESYYQMNYRLKLKVNGEINNDYGVTFAARKNEFTTSGGLVPDLTKGAVEIPILRAFDEPMY